MDIRVDRVFEEFFGLAGAEDEVEVETRRRAISFLFHIEEGITMPEIRFFFGQESFGEEAGYKLAVRVLNRSRTQILVDFLNS